MEPHENSSPAGSESSHEETRNIRRRRNKNKNHARRFSNEQIKSLESIFKLGSKLDPRKKLQIATDLGLQPRQVAIWFQNKRARWKSKQIEQKYKLLRSDYEALLMRFEDMKREKLSLQMQLQELSEVVKNHDNVNKDVELKEYPNSSSTEGMDHNDVVMMNNDMIANYFEKSEEDQQLVSWGGREEEEAKLSQTWRSLSSSDGLFGSSTGKSNWWEN